MNDRSAEVEAVIEQIELALKEDGSIEEFVKLVSQLVAVAQESYYSIIEPGLRLFRATKHHSSVPRRLDELSHPPANLARLGRANRDGAPMFYCCSSHDGALLEIQAVPGDIVIVSEWLTCATMNLHPLGYVADSFRDLGSNRALPRHHFDALNNLDTPSQIVRQYVGRKFTTRGSSCHRFTAAVAEVHLQSDILSGIMYPSIAKSADLDNFALFPGFVRDGMTLASAQIMRVEWVEESGICRGPIEGTLVSASGDGELNWKVTGPPAVVPLGEGGFRTVPGFNYIALRRQDARFEECEYQIEPGYFIDATVEPNRVLNYRKEPVAPSRYFYSQVVADNA